MKPLFFCLLFCSCVNKKLLEPADMSLKKEVNWEHLYARELSNALFHDDDLAFHFFWPYYLKERHRNKSKALNKGISE